MKKGFTLAELLGVIIILGAVLLIITATFSNILKQSEEDLYNDQINSIKLALESWMSDNQKPNIGEKVKLSLSQLKEAGLIDLEIKNPKTKELFPNDMVLEIFNNEGIIEYNVNVTGTNFKDYNSITSIKVNGNVLQYVEQGGSGYTDPGVTAKDSNGSIVSNVTSETTPTLNLKEKGTYITKYTTSDNVAYRTIIVRDTTGPVISFDKNLEMTYEESKTYDFKSDITVTDNSNEEVSVEVSNNITLLPGNYTIKYVATDSSGNETIKLRKITIKE